MRMCRYKNSGGKVVFLGGFHVVPLCTNGIAGYLMQLTMVTKC